MMSRLMMTLVIAGCGCFPGCGREDVSLDGKVVQTVSCHPYRHTPEDVAADALHDARLAMSHLPAIVPAIERLERGEGTDPLGRLSYEWLLVFNDVRAARNSEYRRILRESVGEGLFGGHGKEYLMHDATPHVRTTTHGRLQQFACFSMYLDTAPGTISELEEIVNALPGQISTITKLAWGRECDEVRRRPPNPNMRQGVRYMLLATFENEGARDACLAHSAYHEFEDFVKANTADPIHYAEYIAHVEYIAK